MRLQHMGIVQWYCDDCDSQLIGLAVSTQWKKTKLKAENDHTEKSSMIEE